MTYLDHLNDDAFGDPIRFRVSVVEGDTLIPSYEIDKLLDDEYGLERSVNYDVALTVDDPNRAEFAFDATAVSDPGDIISDVEAMLETYNEPPAGLREEQKAEWRTNTVALTDVSRPTTERDPPAISNEHPQ